MGLQVNKVVGHLPQMQPDTQRLMELVTIMHHERQLLFVYVAIEFVVDCLDLISLPLKAEIRQVFAPVDPISDCSLDPVDDRYQDFLDHL